MNIIMNEAMQGKSKFSRVFMVTLPKNIKNENGPATPMDWHLAMKNLTQSVMEDDNKEIIQGPFTKEGDEGILPIIYQSHCTNFTNIGTAATFMMDIPTYDEKTINKTPVVNEIVNNLLNEGIYIPFLMFIGKEDYLSVMDAAENDYQIYIILISELTSEARGENLTDFYVATMNLSELVAYLNFTENDFIDKEDEEDENRMRILYPMLMSAVSTDISSPYPQHVFQVSTYFQNVNPIGKEEVPVPEEQPEEKPEKPKTTKKTTKKTSRKTSTTKKKTKKEANKE